VNKIIVQNYDMRSESWLDGYEQRKICRANTEVKGSSLTRRDSIEGRKIKMRETGDVFKRITKS
jgi:hypothetical protein